MKNIIIILTLLLFSISACKKLPVPPPGAKVLVPKKNIYNKKRNIYQQEIEGSFNSKNNSHVYWIGIKSVPHHKLFTRLLSNNKNIFYSVTYLGENLKVYKCKDFKDSTIPGCKIDSLPLQSREILIEVLFNKTKEDKNSKKEYRLFTGISGKKKLDFISRKK